MVADCQISREDFKEMKYGWSHKWKTFKRSRIVQKAFLDKTNQHVENCMSVTIL